MNKSRLFPRLVSMCFLLQISNGIYAADLSAGKVAATQCAVCHGVYGEGVGIPGSKIAGMDIKTFKKHLYDFKNRRRRNYMMEMFVNRLSDQDIENLAAFFASR